LHFCSFCKSTFPGATRGWDALYKETHWKVQTCLPSAKQYPMFLSYISCDLYP
jgi:hypothetical protein